MPTLTSPDMAFMDAGIAPKRAGARGRRRMERPTFDVQVEFDPESGMWIGECDALDIVTEAPSIDALMERVWELAPEMIEVNQLGIDPEAVRLRFDLPTDNVRRPAAA